jgi:hypothetical protein
MAQASEANRYSMNAFSWPVPAFLGTPMVSLVADFNGKLLQSVAGAQKEWADFVHRRVKEDVAISQQLISCQSLAECKRRIPTICGEPSSTIRSKPKGPCSEPRRRSTSS